MLKVLFLFVKNINFSNRTIYLDVTKNKNNRFVVFTEGTSFLLQEYIKNKKDEMLFNTNASTIGSLFYRIKNRLDWNKFHPHMLRHTLATRLHKNKVSVFYIQKLMGHTNVATTQKYIHFDLDDILENYNAVIK